MPALSPDGRRGRRSEGLSSVALAEGEDLNHEFHELHEKNRI